MNESYKVTGKSGKSSNLLDSHRQREAENNSVPTLPDIH